jgi:hypothetical protein
LSEHALHKAEPVALSLTLVVSVETGENHPAQGTAAPRPSAREKKALMPAPSSPGEADRTNRFRQDGSLRDGRSEEIAVKDRPLTIDGAVDRIRQLVEEADGHTAMIERSEGMGPQEVTLVAEVASEAFPGFLNQMRLLGRLQGVDEEAARLQNGPTVRFSIRVTVPRG